MNNQYDTQPPFAYRLVRALLSPFGLRWVGDHQRAVIFRMERYQGVKGPGFFWICPFIKSVYSIISVAPDFTPIQVSSIQTKDALQLGLSLALAYAFDPSLVPAEKAALYIKWPREVRRAVATDNAQRALQAVVPEFFAEQICRGEVFPLLEQKFLSILTDRLQSLALKPVFAMVLEVKVPAMLQHRFEDVVQRSVNIEDFNQYAPHEFTQALQLEMIEALKHMGVGKQFISLPEGKEGKSLPAAGQVSPRRIARLVSNPSENHHPPAERPETPAAAVNTEVILPKKRPKSRL